MASSTAAAMVSTRAISQTTACAAAPLSRHCRTISSVASAWRPSSASSSPSAASASATARPIPPVAPTTRALLFAILVSVIGLSREIEGRPAVVYRQADIRDQVFTHLGTMFDPGRFGDHNADRPAAVVYPNQAAFAR